LTVTSTILDQQTVVGALREIGAILDEACGDTCSADCFLPYDAWSFVWTSFVPVGAFAAHSVRRILFYFGSKTNRVGNTDLFASVERWNLDHER